MPDESRLLEPCSRRKFLRASGLGVGGLGIAGLRLGGLTIGGLFGPSLPALNRPAHGFASGATRGKSVIMVCLGGGPSQLDTYDMKPSAPAESRGEFRPIATNVAGFELCELMPCQARIADKFSVVRSAQWVEPDHQRAEVFSGFPRAAKRPSFGSIVSRLYQGDTGSLPRFVSLSSEYNQELQFFEAPLYVGAEHRPFIPTRAGLDNMSLLPEIKMDRMQERTDLLRSLDNLASEIDVRSNMTGVDAFTAKALELVTKPSVREAFDVDREPQAVRERYGLPGAKFEYNRYPVDWDSQAFLRARRLVEAGVPYVSLQVGLWDHHGGESQGSIFNGYRTLLPHYDRSLNALIEDLAERGLDKDVVVVVWGEFGRTPKVNSGAGRDHWPQAGCVLFSGGGLQMGQVIGATDKTASLPTTKAYSPQNVLATLYHVLGIDPATTLADFSGRPTYLLDEREPITELV